MISFNVPPFVGKELDYIKQAVEARRICGDGSFTRKCSEWLEKRFGTERALLTTSGTSALDMSALLLKLEPGDEVIMSSFTFPSTATAFVMAGAVPVFVDIRPDTMNIDERLIEAAVTERTRAIVVMHYAGVACEMDTIMSVARRHGLRVVEDAAQAVMSGYRGSALGTIGALGCYSFHETKNYSMGEGGALLINDPRYIERAEIIREKGTDRSKFYRGEIDKYTWIDVGGSYLPADINAAYLWAQLEAADEINASRKKAWDAYYEELKPLADAGAIEIPVIPEGCEHNAHIFYIKAADIEERARLIKHLRDNGVQSVFHYLPLHSSPAGARFGRFCGEDRFTTKESERLLRLPMYYGLEPEKARFAAKAVKSFYGFGD